MKEERWNESLRLSKELGEEQKIRGGVLWREKNIFKNTSYLNYNDSFDSNGAVL